MDRVDLLLKDKIMSPEEAAEMIKENMCLGFSGFTLVGCPSAVPKAVAKLCKAKNLSILTGASVGDSLDGEIARAGLMRYRAPYQSNGDVRNGINKGSICYNDFHLSQFPCMIDDGAGPHMDFAIIECAAVTSGGILPGLSVGANDAFVRNADKIILEVNFALSMDIIGMHDIFTAAGHPIDISSVSDRVGAEFIPCNPEKIAAIVLTDGVDNYPTFKVPDEISTAIAGNIVRFLNGEVAAGRQPSCLRPLQSGVGNVANAVLAGLEETFEGLTMYTEVMQDAAFELVKKGVITSASTTCLSLSKACMEEFYTNIEYYTSRILLRPQEIANSPEVIRRLKVISMNTPIEVDIYGNVNSTHIMGSKIMNGIGGSGDYARNAGLTIFASGSLAKNGDISCVVPMVSHVDHTEHDVDIIVTECGVADLRWKTPRERAAEIIENCAHPDYRDALRDYYHRACQFGGQTPHILGEALSWHDCYNKTGTMKASSIVL